MDPRVAPIVQALTDCAREMRQHAGWIEGLLRKTYMLWTVPGEYEANLTAAVATREHAKLMEARIETIERAFIEPGDHSQLCHARDDAGRYMGCTPWCRASEPRPVSRPAPAVSALPAKVVAPEAPKDEGPKQDRFSLIELE